MLESESSSLSLFHKQPNDSSRNYTSHNQGPKGSDLLRKLAASSSRPSKQPRLKNDLQANTSTQDVRAVTPNIRSNDQRKRSVGPSNTKINKRTNLNISEIDHSDPDYFFENFDRIFKVSENTSDEPVAKPEQQKMPNIRRILLDDFSYSPQRALSCKPGEAEIFIPEGFSVKFITNKEKTIPKLDNVGFESYPHAKTDCEVPTTTSNLETEQAKDISKPTADIIKFDLLSKLAKEKLPDLKIAKSLADKTSSFQKLPNDGTSRIIEKINKFHENFISRNRAKVSLVTKGIINIDTGPISGKNRNTQQLALEDLLKYKKVDKTTRSKTVVAEDIKDIPVAQAQGDDMRPRVNSLQCIENSNKSKIVPKNDLSLDLGNGNGSSKVKFILKTLEQRTSSYYYQGILNKVQNGSKDVKSTNATSRSHYHKENLSLLLNSSRDKILEGQKIKKAQDNNTNLVSKNGENNVPKKNLPAAYTTRMKVGDMTQLYKVPRQSVKSKDEPKMVKNIRIGVSNFNPLKDLSNISIDSRSTSVPKRCKS